MQSLYQPGDSPLHRLHPLTKLALAILAIVSAAVVPLPIGGIAAMSGLVALLCLALAAGCGVGLPALRNSVAVTLPIAISLFIIQGLIAPLSRTMPLLNIAGFTLWADGLLFALPIALRFYATAVWLMLLVITTHPGDLVAGLAQIGLPRSIGLIIVSALQIIPEMGGRAAAILEAQRSRGLATEGAINRTRALLPLVAPLLIGALAESQERAMSLGLRTFLLPGPKTALRTLDDSAVQRALRWLCILLAIAAIVWSVLT